MIKLIVGLGNPGSRYEGTRHNVGVDFLDKWASQDALLWKEHKALRAHLAEWWLDDQYKILLAKPTTYMNESGQAVGAILRYYNVECPSLLVVHDELDLSPGIARLKFAGGHGGHNGLRDIIQKAGGADFYRLRFGIGRTTEPDAVKNYVLTRPPAKERESIAYAMDSVMPSMPLLLRGDDQGFMQHLHTLL